MQPILLPGVSVPEAFETLRPQALSPQQFLELTAALFGREGALRKDTEGPFLTHIEGLPQTPSPIIPKVPIVWRKPKHGDY